MSGVTDLYFPSADARELNGDLRKEHLAFLDRRTEEGYGTTPYESRLVVWVAASEDADRACEMAGGCG